MAWLGDWQYRKSHVISQQAGAGTNYQVAIKVYYGSGTDGTESLGSVTAGKVYCNSKCKTDFGDIRFTQSDGETLIDCWREEKTDSDYALYWIEVPDDLSADNVTVYIYYGNASASYPYLASDLAQGQATFPLFDDFEDGALGAWWTVVSGTPVETGGILTVKGSGSTACDVRSTSTLLTDHRLKTRAKLVDLTGDMQLGVMDTIGGTTERIFFWRYSGVAGRTHTRVNGSGEDQAFTFDSDIDIYEYLWKTGTSAKFYLNGTLKNTHSTKVPDGSPAMAIRLLSVTNHPQLDVYWIFVSKYISPEPAHSTWGDEEASGKVLTITSTPVNGITFTVSIDDGDPEEHVTPWNDSLPEGSDVVIVVTESEPFESGGHKYWWLKWDDDETSKTRSFTLNDDTTLDMIWYLGKLLTINGNPITGFEVTVNAIPQTIPFSDEYELNDVVTVTFTETEPFELDGHKYWWLKWENESTDTSREITMNDDHTITAFLYQGKQLQISIQDIDGITSLDIEVDGVGKTVSVGSPFIDEYSLNDSVVVEFVHAEPIVPDDHFTQWKRFYFDCWLDGTTRHTNDPTTFVMSEDIELEIILKEQYVAPYSGIFPEDTVVRVTMPETHVGFPWLHWLEDSEVSRARTVIMDDDYTFTGIFSPSGVRGTQVVEWEYIYGWKHVPSESVIARITNWSFHQTQRVKSNLQLLFHESKPVEAIVGEGFAESNPVSSVVESRFEESQTLRGALETTFSETAGIAGSTVIPFGGVSYLRVKGSSLWEEQQMFDRLRRL